MKTNRRRERTAMRFVAFSGTVVMSCLLRAAPVGTPYAGLAVGPVDEFVRQQLPSLQGAGVSVRAVDPGGPANTGGMQAHDILWLWDDQKLFTPGQLRALIHSLTPGQSHEVTVYRRGKSRALKLVLGSAPSAPPTGDAVRALTVPFYDWNDVPDFPVRLQEILSAAEPDPEDLAGPFGLSPERLLGVRLRPVDPRLASQLDLARPEGVIIDGLIPGRSADLAGLQTLDLVMAMDETPLKDRDDLADRLRGRTPGEVLNLRVLRSGQVTELHLTRAENPAGGSEATVSETWPPRVKPWSAVSADLETTAEWIVILQKESPSSEGEEDVPADTAAPAVETLSSGSFVLQDDRGSIEVNEEDEDSRYIVLRNEHGSIIFRGTMDADGSQSRLRPDLRRRIQDMIEPVERRLQSSRPFDTIQLWRVPRAPGFF